MLSMPIYRAKKIDSDEYVEGFYVDTVEFLGKILKNKNGYISRDGQWAVIDKSTLSIHFPDMIDSHGNKIFASLSENGKGGDKIIENGKYEYSFNPIFNPYFRVSSFSIEDLPKAPYGQYELHKYKVIGIQK